MDSLATPFSLVPSRLKTALQSTTCILQDSGILIAFCWYEVPKHGKSTISLVMLSGMQHQLSSTYINLCQSTTYYEQ